MTTKNYNNLTSARSYNISADDKKIEFREPRSSIRSTEPFLSDVFVRNI